MTLIDLLIGIVFLFLPALLAIYIADKVFGCEGFAAMAASLLGIIPGVLLLRWLSRPRRTLTFAWDYHRREGDTMHVYGFTICGEGTGTNAISKSDVRHFRRFVLWYFSTNYDVRHVVLRGERPTSSLPEDSDEIVLSLDNVKRSHDR